MTEQALQWLVYRRDHPGNLDLAKVRIDGVEKYCWNLTEADANAMIDYIQHEHRKPHGQTYDKISYPEGTLRQLLRERDIRV